MFETRTRYQRSRLMLVPVFCLLLASCAELRSGDLPASMEADVANDAVAFVNVTVIPMDAERVIEGQTVIVQDGRITAIGPVDGTTIPPEALRIEGEGRYVMPGLAEMHGHIPGDDRQYAEDVLFLYVANGVTLVRGMQGHSSHLELRDQVAQGELLGPTIFAAGPWFAGNNAATAEAAESRVREQHAAGYDLLKVMSPSQEGYGAMARTAHELGIPFGGHVPASVGIVGALEARQISVDHLDSYVEYLVADGATVEGRGFGFFGSSVVDLVDTGKIPEIVEATRAAGVWNVPTLSLVDNIAAPETPEEMIAAPEMRYIPQDVRDEWIRAKHGYQQREDFQPEAAQRLVEIRRELTKALHDAGAPIALGSDAPQWFNVPGFSVHREMAMMVAAGLTPYEVLVTGTRNPAIYFETPDEFGTVEVGRRADLMLLDANPLQDIGNAQRIAGVMVQGIWLPREEIEQRLDDIAARVAGEP
jgi:imidazolonepropionase-like amidohydrolase